MKQSTQVCLFVLLFSCLTCIARAGGPSLYPCPPDKWLQKQDVSCTGVQLPPGLCSSCYLNTPLGNGQFQDCSDIYNKNGGCLAQMNDYVNNNQCDGRRATIMSSINSGSASWIDWASLDYFLYSVCEMCCDCIPMGASKGVNEGQWITDRGNCPAHAYYDVCQVLPSVKYFRKIGEQENGALENGPSMCQELNNWFNSEESQNWQTNPDTYISPALDTATATLLNSIECSNPNVWNTCFDLESKQSNLGTPGEITNTGTQGGAEAGSGETNVPLETGNGESSNGCDGQVKWTCLEGREIGGKFCCQKPGCQCVPGPVNLEPEDGCYEHGAYPKPGVGYGLADCSGNVRWGCLDAIYDGPGCEWTCLNWGCMCYPFEEKTDNWCTEQKGAISKEGDVPTIEKASCFPDEAQAQNIRGPVAMARLRVGDMVLAKPGVYSPIFMFSHSDGGASTAMKQVILDSGKELSLSLGHHILVGEEEIPARDLHVGHVLYTVDGMETVLSVQSVRKTGLYNPHTVAGTIVVNGVVCSTYTQHVHHYTAHALLAPLRAMWFSGIVSSDSFASLMQFGVAGRIYSDRIHTRERLLGIQVMD